MLAAVVGVREAAEVVDIVVKRVAVVVVDSHAFGDWAVGGFPCNLGSQFPSVWLCYFNVDAQMAVAVASRLFGSYWEMVAGALSRLELGCW